MWRKATNLGAYDFGVAEHETLLEGLRLAALYDQYDVTNSAAFEHYLRRVQMIEYAHQEKLRDQQPRGSKGGGSSGGLAMEEQDAFLGSRRLGAAMVAPKLV
eukprot:7459549-Lingulodinium_polyedra.AAC.1